MNRFKFLRYVSVVISVFVASLNGSAEVKYLVVNLNDGTNATFALADDPVITNTSSALQVKTAEKSIEVSFSNLKNYQFSDSDSGVFENFASKDGCWIQNDIIHIDGLKPQTAVNVFTLDGRLLNSTNADADGRTHIDLSSFSLGVYIVAYNNKAIKILIP